MEVQMSAAFLRDLLVAHRNAQKQVLAIDVYINHLNQQILRTSLDGNHGYNHHLTLRSSVAMGIKQMYQQYVDRKWTQVQETAKKIIDSLEGDSLVELESGLRNYGRSAIMDQAAPQWSTLFSECYRHN